MEWKSDGPRSINTAALSFGSSTMSDLVLRPFAWSDVPAITATYRHYVEHSTATFDIAPPGETAMAEKFGHIVDAGYPALVAEGEGKVLAYAYANVYRPRPAYRFTCEDSIYCAPDAQGRGIGRALLTRVIEESRRMGQRQMIGVITAESEASIRLHEKLGFRIVGTYEAVGLKFDRWLDIIHMQKAL